MDEELERKLKIENLTSCMNCRKFVTCKEPFKENVVDCSHHFVEEPQERQVVVVRLDQWCEKRDQK